MPTVPVEPAVPAELVLLLGVLELTRGVFPRPLFPAGLATFEALPAPLGSLAELLRPAALAGPFGIPFTAAVPAPAAPAFGEPTELLVPTVGPLAAPGAPPELAPPALPPGDDPPALPPPPAPPPPPPLPWARTATAEQVRDKATSRATFEIALLFSPIKFRRNKWIANAEFRSLSKMHVDV